MNPLSIRQQLHRLTKSKLALSTVVTTLIVLVVAVLLAGVVTYFAINVTSTRVQEESLALAKQHVWFDYSTGKAQAAIMVINAGGRDVVVDKLTVRGQVCDWSKVFYNVTGESISGDLASSSTLTDGGTISVGGSNHIFKQATNDLTLQSGKTLIIYLDNPDSISVNDVGLTVSVNIFTSQAMYYKETNVQGTSGSGTQTTPIESTNTIDILYAAAWGPKGMNKGEVGLIVKNVGSSTISFDDSNLRVKGETEHVNIYGYVGDFVATNDFTESDNTIQGHPTEYLSSVSIPSGHTAIITFDTSKVLQSDVGNSITLAVVLDNDHTDSIQVTVQESRLI
jgi:hypothetical protein